MRLSIAGVAGSPVTSAECRLWMSEVSRYQWLVLAVAWLGWVFDSMDGTLYTPCTPGSL